MLNMPSSFAFVKTNVKVSYDTTKNWENSLSILQWQCHCQIIMLLCNYLHGSYVIVGVCPSVHPFACLLVCLFVNSVWIFTNFSQILDVQIKTDLILEM